MKTILLKFAGPLQSWGTDSHFETRHTDFYPSKSAVIGMIAASLGYRRDEDEKIRPLNDLKFGVRVDQKGNLLRDYQIAAKYKAKNGEFDRNYVTNRYYLTDFIFLVAIGSEDDELIDEIEYALKHPYFSIFLGRRSNPPTYDYFIEKNDLSVMENLENYKWLANKKYKNSHDNTVSIYCDADLVDEKNINFRRDKVKSFSQKNRSFLYRAEIRKDIKVRNDDNDTDHDAISAIGG